jgi:hypothetical protein
VGGVRRKNAELGRVRRKKCRSGGNKEGTMQKLGQVKRKKCRNGGCKEEKMRRRVDQERFKIKAGEYRMADMSAEQEAKGRNRKSRK